MKKENNKKCMMGRRIMPPPVKGGEKITDLVDNHFECYNAARIRECCELLSKRALASQDVTVGMSLSGALTPGGMGAHSIVPLMKAGFVDWITSTGANLYHDTHFALGMALHRGGVYHDDVALRKHQIIRIYDILFDFDVLLNTDAFFYRIFQEPEFRKTMTTTELHYRIGGYVAAREKALGLKDVSILATAHRLEIPIFAPAPGDSSIALNMAKAHLEGQTITLDVMRDINESAAIILEAKKKGRSAVFILGGGTPKNYLLQTEPQLQEVLGISEKGHDYFIQITDARVDTGGLSGATPSEAVTWGKIDQEMLPNAVVCYTDVSIALPIITSYVLSKNKKRTQKRLYARREELLEKLKIDFIKSKQKTKKTGAK